MFIPGTAPGDVAAIRIVKDCGRYAFGILDAIQTPSPDRIPVDCAVAGPCGGCSLRHLDYAAELRAKGESVTDAFRRIGGLDTRAAAPPLSRDRPLPQKVQFPVGCDKNGKPCIGFYAGRTHRIVPCPRLQAAAGCAERDWQYPLRFLLPPTTFPAPTTSRRARGWCVMCFCAGVSTAARLWSVWSDPGKAAPRRGALPHTDCAVCRYRHHPDQCQRQKHQCDSGQRDPHPVRSRVH